MACLTRGMRRLLRDARVVRKQNAKDAKEVHAKERDGMLFATFAAFAFCFVLQPVR